MSVVGVAGWPWRHNVVVDEANSLYLEASISVGGRYVAFASAASDLVAGDTDGHVDLFACDRVSG